MAEETEQKSTTVIGQEGEFQLSKYVGEDGTFLDGWKENLLPEEFRQDKFFDTLHDVKSVLKTAGHQAKRIGAGERAVVIPDDKSSPEEVAAYRKAWGVPDKPDGYKMPEIPKELEEYYKQPMVAESVGELHKLDLNQKQFDAIMALDRKRIEATEKALADFELQQNIEAEKIIEQNFGKDKEVMLHQVRLAVDNLTKKWSPEKKAALFGKDTGVNDPAYAELRPLLFEYLANVGEMFKEGTMSEAETLQVGARIQQEIESLRKTEAMTNPAHKDHEAAVKQLDELYKKLYPGK